ncbi:MAG: hypothetical protein NC918_00950 [Candidatus Omnitrophica bacterium]|nr:hypothetical protein [Candidatus Omnitrophota bacterium]
MPDYEYSFPPLGTACLCGFLKSKKIDTIQIDLNILYRKFLINKIEADFLNTEDKKKVLKQVLFNFFYKKLKDRYYSNFLPRNTDKIFPFLPYENNSNSSFYFTERLLSSDYLFYYLSDIKENTFYQFYQQEKILDFLDKEKINLCGISVISPSQVIASLTLGLLIKKNLPHIHITFGGQWVTLYRKELIKRKFFFNCFDSLIVFEGETPLYRLCCMLRKKRKYNIQNVIFKETEEDFTYNHTEEDLNRLPTPNFDGLPLGEYDASDCSTIKLTYETSRGCYWSKCAYCVDLPLPKPTYRRKPAYLVANDIKILKKKYKATHFLFSDPAVSPRQMLEVSKELLKQKININWWCMARPDSGFNYKIFKTAYKAGLTHINFGFETANDRLYQLLSKGTKLSTVEKVIKNCAKAKVLVDLQTMLGLPQESFQEGLNTIEFLVKNKKYIFNTSFNLYYLTPQNHIFCHPEKYKIEYKQKYPFSFFIPFKNKCGLTRKQAYLLWLLYDRLTSRERTYNLNPKDIKSIKIPNYIEEKIIYFKLLDESIRLYCLFDKKSKKFIVMDRKRKSILKLLNEKKLNFFKSEHINFLNYLLDENFLKKT